MTSNQRLRLSWWDAALVFAVLAIIWEAASRFMPPYLFPSVGRIGGALVRIASSGGLQEDLALTVVRILMGLVLSFALGSALGIASAIKERVARFSLPLNHFLMGIPAISWVVIAIIWFPSVEGRILFIIFMSTFPNFLIHAYDGILAVPKDLVEMLLAFRPTPWQRFRKVLLPGVTPHLFTAWKVNLGLGARIAVTAELVGASLGVGYRLSRSQELFDMASAISWTLLLSVFLIFGQQLIALIERRVLRWRPQSSR